MATPTVISSQSVVCGDMVSSACIYVEGKVAGNIRCDCLVVRKGGSVQGDIIANSVVLDGDVVGTVRSMHIHLKKHARVDGSLSYTKIIIEHGAQITGQLSTEHEENNVKNVVQDIKNSYITNDSE